MRIAPRFVPKATIPQRQIGDLNALRRRRPFTFPEIARQLRARVERQIGHILPEFLRPEERPALLAESESRWGFQRLDDKAQDRGGMDQRRLR